MIKPTVHLNGTSSDELAKQYVSVATALIEARKALAEAAPNRRDYYPQGEAAWNQAVAEHNSRDKRLASVYAEIHELFESIAEQELQRGNRT